MGSQTRTWQSKIIDGAKQRNDLDSLYWMVEMKLPASLGGGFAAATYPTRCVPVLPLAPDPEESRHWAHLLLELFKCSNVGRGIEFDLALTNDDLLRETASAWYVYGQRSPARDVVCLACGGILMDGRCDCQSAMQPPTVVWIGGKEKLHISRDGSALPMCGGRVHARWVHEPTAAERRQLDPTVVCGRCAKLR